MYIVKEREMKEMNIEITLDEKLLDDKDMDFFHYGESYELAKCEYGTFYVSSRGELKCWYIDEEKDIETRDYVDIIRYYVKNNDEYCNAVESGKLAFDLNNWFEIEFFTKSDNNISSEYVCLTDDIFGSISECLATFKEYIKDKEVMKEFEEEVKEVGVIND